MELHKKKENQDYDPTAFATLQTLKERLKGKDLFNDKDSEEFERLKEMFPEEYAILENDEAFQEKTEAEQRQILFDMVNPDSRIKVEDGKIIGTIE